MNLDLTAEQRFLRDGARRLLGERADSASLRRAMAGGGFDRELWRVIGELQWCAVAIPEETGGSGLGALELVVLAEETGRRLAPAPVWSTACLASSLIQAVTSDPARAALLTRIVAGEAMAVALPEPAGAQPFAAAGVSAKKISRGYALRGRVSPVFDLAAAELLFVPAAMENGGLALFALAPDAGFETRPLDAIDLTRPAADLIFPDVAVPDSARVDRGDLVAGDFAAALASARLGLAAEQIGAAQGCFDLTLAYISGRVQFGRTIASFQAVKHRCAALLVEIAEARSLIYGAAQSLDAAAPGAALEIAAAGALASAALFRAAEEAIQLHGGVGNSWDYDPHLYLRRAQASAFMLGSAQDRFEEIAGALLGEAA